MPPQGQPTFESPKKSKAPILAIVFGILFLAALVFGISQYQAASSNKKDADQKAATAATAAATAQQVKDKADFADQLKAPYKTFAGPASYGSIKFSYPKTWSAYVDQSNSSEPINAYFYPDIVPSVNGNTAYALRVELTTSPYSNVVSNYQSQIQSGSIKASAYVPPKMASNANVQRGTRLDGAINSNQTGSMVILPVRDQTLQIYTESTDFVPDFNKIVLPSLTYSP